MSLEDRRRFSKTIKQYAFELRGKKCERCEKEYSSFSALSYHHKYIWQYEANYYLLPGTFVASLANMEVLCPECHKNAHRHKEIRPPDELLEGILTLGEILNDTETAKTLVGKVVFTFLLYESFHQTY